jgi:hypothetical protein
MRVAPVIPLTARIAKRDIVLPDGRPVPAGTAFILNSTAMHNEERWFPNANKFIPVITLFLSNSSLALLHLQPRVQAHSFCQSFGATLHIREIA